MRPNAQWNVLIVPSWYPTDRYPYFGVFIREQAQALRAFAPEISITVWNWCPGQFRASFKRPLEFMRLLHRWRKRPAPHWITDDSGLRTYVHPAFQPPRPFTTASRAFVRTLARVANEVTLAHGPIHLVHAHVAMPAGWACTELFPTRGVPTVVTEHMGPQLISDLRPSGELDPMWRAAYTRADSVVAVSSTQAALLRQLTGTEVIVLPNVVNEEQFIPAETPLPPDSPFLVVAGLRPVKDIGRLLTCYARACSTQSLPRLRIGGDGPLRKSLVRLAGTLGIAERVEFLGELTRDEVRTEMRRCAALIISSTSESFSVSTIEAMSSGRPVLSTACGGPDEIITESTGILVRNRDDDALIQGLRQMSLCWSRYDPHTIRRHAITHYGRASVARRLAACYQGLLGGSGDTGSGLFR